MAAAGVSGVSRWMTLLIAALVAFLPMPAAAAVEISFYSHEFGSRFPHAFVTLEGALDRGGERIDANYGFSATALSPAILMGAVRGKLYSESPAYIRSSQSHFTFTLTDQEFDLVATALERWRTLIQPSYDLKRQNCVSFVADLAKALGMTVDTSRLMKKPRSFLQRVAESNRTWLEARGATFGGA